MQGAPVFLRKSIESRVCRWGCLVTTDKRLTIRVQRSARGQERLLLVLMDAPVSFRFLSGPKRLVADRRALRVVYTSGYTEEAIVQHGVLKAGIAFLHKPFTSETLGEKIREVLER